MVTLYYLQSSRRKFDGPLFKTVCLSIQGIDSNISVELTLNLTVPPSAWADGKLAGLAEKQGNLVEHRRYCLSHYFSP